jgi:hypothetical protein
MERHAPFVMVGERLLRYGPIVFVADLLSRLD